MGSAGGCGVGGVKGGDADDETEQDEAQKEVRAYERGGRVDGAQSALVRLRAMRSSKRMEARSRGAAAQRRPCQASVKGEATKKARMPGRMAMSSERTR
jgi:hypothetical protein